MKNNSAFLFLLFLLLYRAGLTQMPDFSKVVHFEPQDSAAISYLINHGIQVKKGKAIAWFPKDSLTTKQMQGIVDTLDKGIVAAEKFIGGPYPWQVHKPNEPYTFFYRFDNFIAHASLSGFVSISFSRVHFGDNPWLHETMHEMLNPKAGNWLDDKTNTEKEWAENMPLWMAEGLPEYISSAVSVQNHFPLYFLRTKTPWGNIDSACRQNLANERGAYILSFIGKKGTMPELFGDKRRDYAPAFYNCSCSFVKYIAEQKGPAVLLKSFSSYPREQETLEKLLPPFADVKKAWIERLNLTKQ